MNDLTERPLKCDKIHSTKNSRAFEIEVISSTINNFVTSTRQEEHRRASVERWKRSIELDSNAASIGNDTCESILNSQFYARHPFIHWCARKEKPKFEMKNEKTGGRRSEKLANTPISHPHMCVLDLSKRNSELHHSQFHTTIKIQQPFSWYVSIFNLTVGMLREQNAVTIFVSIVVCVCGVHQVIWQRIRGQFYGRFYSLPAKSCEREGENRLIEMRTTLTKLSHCKVVWHHPVHIDAIRENFDTANVIQLQCVPI